MKVKIQKINDPDTTVEINSPAHRIDQIKSEILRCGTKELCEVPVYDMWNDLPE